MNYISLIILISDLVPDMVKVPIPGYFGFTLVELIVVIVILGILGTVALGKFEDLTDDAESAKVDMIFATASSYLSKMNSIRYALEGSPDNATFVAIDDVSVRFFNGSVRNTQTNAHVPVGTPNRNNQATRFWYMMFSVPPPVIGRNDNSSGDGQCTPAPPVAASTAVAAGSIAVAEPNLRSLPTNSTTARQAW